MSNRYLQEATEIVRKQQGKRGPVWMCGEQLLEENGIVGPFTGSNPREVLPTDEPDDAEG